MSKYWFVAIIVLGAIGVGTVPGNATEPQARPLLEQATRIAPLKNPGAYSDYGPWLSDHAVISVDYPEDWRKPPIIAFHNISTGKTHKIPFTRWPMGTHTHVMCSGDGRWALSWNGEGPKAGDRVVAMNLQTGRTLSWPSLGNVYHLNNLWLSDNRRWLQFPTLEEGYFNVYSVEKPTKVARVDFPAADEANWRTHGHRLTNTDHLLIYNDPGIRGDAWKKLDIQEYRLFPSVTLLRKAHLYPPTGQNLREVCFSPAGDRIAWVADDSQGHTGLWVGRIDGKAAIEIGSMPDRHDRLGNHPQLSWLPDGKRLSFVYNDTLYTVPVGSL